MSELYRQCELRRGDAVQVAWIPSRYAVVGGTIRLQAQASQGGMWEVTKVFAIETREYLDNQRAANRRWKSVIDP